MLEIQTHFQWFPGAHWSKVQAAGGTGKGTWQVGWLECLETGIFTNPELSHPNVLCPLPMRHAGNHIAMLQAPKEDSGKGLGARLTPEHLVPERVLLQEGPALGKEPRVLRVRSAEQGE